MLIYSGTKKQFDRDVKSGRIAPKIEHEFYLHGLNKESIGEFHAWENSLAQMQRVLDDDRFSKDLQVAVEFQIPQTSKRVDFLIGGIDENENEHVVVVELKQWEEAFRTQRDGVVSAVTGNMLRAVAHPSYQAYSYAKTIENFNATVQDENIQIHPCAYLHNYRKSKLEELTAPLYQEILEYAPIYIKNEDAKLKNFISRYVKAPAKGDLLYKIDHGKIRPSKALQDTVLSMIQGNQEFVMIDEQKVVYEAIKELVDKAVKEEKKYTVIIQGGPGTGKSVVAIQLLADLTAHKELVVSYVTKNAAPRNVYFEKLKKGKVKLNYVKTMFKGSGVFVDSESNLFDCLLVDEAHRLNAKSGMFQNLGENQIKEIINAARVSVFFIDEDQVVTSKDIGSIDEIKKWANELESEVIEGEEFKLTSQFRCNGSDGYIAFLDDVLEIRRTAHHEDFDLEYELKVIDDPCEMRELLREKNKERNKARMLAGYCYKWLTKNSNDLTLYDIEIGDKFRARWNFSNTNTWAIDEDSFEQIGCIHTSQGLEFDYIGVIIGQDLRYENGHVVTDAKKRAKTDQSLRGLKMRPDYEEVCDRIIRNTYKTLLTRGQKGCYIFCEDKALSEYLKYRISIRDKKKVVYQMDEEESLMVAEEVKGYLNET